MRDNRLPLTRAGLRQLRFFLVLTAVYLIQVCVLPYLDIGGVTPNLMIIAMAVVIVSYGRLRGFWAGAFFGILLETMMPTLPLLDLIFYPVAALFTGMFFANKSERRRELERSQNKAGRDVNPYLRILLGTVTLTALYEAVNLIYVYLGGNDITAGHLSRAFTDLWITALPSLPVGFLLRRCFGFRRRREEDAEDAAPRYV